MREYDKLVDVPYVLTHKAEAGAELGLGLAARACNIRAVLVLVVSPAII